MKKVRIYEYDKCSTCKNALKFLSKKGVEVERVNITEQAPSPAEIEKMIDFQGGDFKKLFNTSGVVYREMKLGTKVPTMSRAEAVKLLSGNGRLVKRPFILLNDKGLVGFREPEWKTAF